MKNTILLNQRGVSLIELAVGVSVLAIMTLVSTSMIRNFSQYQHRLRIQATLAILNEQMRENLKSQITWQNTIDDNANNPALLCLKEKGVCAEGAAIPILMRGVDNEIFFDSRPGTNGFTDNGAPCNTFNNAAGNNACPISFNITAQLNCAGASTTCTNPTVALTSRMLLRPTGPPGFLPESWGPINIASYNTDLIQGAASVYEPLLAAEVFFGAGPTGGCNPTGDFDNDRPFNRELNDPFDNITINPGGGPIVFNKIGSYSCRLKVPSVGVGAFRIRAVNVTDGAVVSMSSVSAVASKAIQEVAQLEFILMVRTIGTVVQIQQTCDQDTSANARGIPVPHVGVAYAGGVGSGGTILSSLDCTKIN